MNIVCAICRGYLIPSDDISFTRCGHVFHSNCLSQWLIRSSSCPQCREKTSQNKIRKLYMTFSNNETDSDNTNNLHMQERMDSMKFQILLNEKHIKYYISKNETLEKQNAGLRQEVRKVESEINRKNSTIYSLKERMQFLEERRSEYESLKHKLSQNKREIEKLKHIKTLLHGSTQDTEEVIEKAKDRDTLVTYILAMKKDMLRNANNKKLLYNCFKEIQNLLIDLSMDIDALGERSKRSNAEKHLAARNWDIHKRIDKLEKLFSITSEENHSMKSSSQRKSNETSFADIQNRKTAYNQETGKQSRLSIPKIETTTNAHQDECPIYRKRARVSRSNDDSNEINETTMVVRHHTHREDKYTTKSQNIKML